MALPLPGVAILVTGAIFVCCRCRYRIPSCYRVPSCCRYRSPCYCRWSRSLSLLLSGSHPLRSLPQPVSLPAEASIAFLPIASAGIAFLACTGMVVLPMAAAGIAFLAAVSANMVVPSHAAGIACLASRPTAGSAFTAFASSYARLLRTSSPPSPAPAALPVSLLHHCRYLVPSCYPCRYRVPCLLRNPCH